ncbi:MAG: metal-sensitive transcriptional regulator [Firmicutes bacterium]|nr:metal-sensitive transcriptional regulator [Bacillota bacterium]
MAHRHRADITERERGGTGSESRGIEREHGDGEVSATTRAAVPAPVPAPAGRSIASRYRRDPEALLRRLRRIEGQVRGVQRMVEEDRYCVDILVQLAAIRAALDEVGLVILADHTRGCVTDAIRSGDGEAVIEELLGAVRRLVR